MRGHRIVVAWAAPAVLVVGLLVVADAPAVAAETSAVGWWTRSPGQEAPEDGFAVATAPDGPVTVAALRFDVGPAGVSRASLTAVETGGVGQGTASLLVCTTSDPWQPVAGGDIESAPSPACDRASVPFERDAAAETWHADITALLGGATGTASVMVVPGPAPESGLGGAVFDVRFAAPVLDAPERSEEPETGRFAGGSGASGGGSPGAGSVSPAASGDQPPAAQPQSAPSAFTPPEPPPAPAPASSEVDQRAGEATTSATSGADGGEQSPEQAASFDPISREVAGDAPWAQALLFVGLSAAVGAAAAFTNRWLRTRAVG